MYGCVTDQAVHLLDSPRALEVLFPVRQERLPNPPLVRADEATRKGGIGYPNLSLSALQREPDANTADAEDERVRQHLANVRARDMGSLEERRDRAMLRKEHTTGVQREALYDKLHRKSADVSWVAAVLALNPLSALRRSPPVDRSQRRACVLLDCLPPRTHELERGRGIEGRSTGAAALQDEFQLPRRAAHVLRAALEGELCLRVGLQRQCMCRYEVPQRARELVLVPEAKLLGLSVVS